MGLNYFARKFEGKFVSPNYSFFYTQVYIFICFRPLCTWKIPRMVPGWGTYMRGFFVVVAVVVENATFVGLSYMLGPEVGAKGPAQPSPARSDDIEWAFRLTRNQYKRMVVVSKPVHSEAELWRISKAPIEKKG